MSTMLKSLVPLLIALVATPVFAEFKLGFVNGQRVVNESPQAKKPNKGLIKSSSGAIRSCNNCPSDCNPCRRAWTRTA